MTVVLVTGAARRIGRHLALGFGRAGCSVGIHYNGSRPEAETLAARIEQAALLPADLSEWNAAEALIAGCEAALGPVDVLINCASTFEYDDMETLEAGTWARNIAVNLAAPVNLIRAIAARGRPAVAVNFLDFKVWRPSASFLSYTLAKTALQNPTTMLAQALAPTVRVNGRRARRGAAERRAERRRIPGRRALHPAGARDCAGRHFPGRALPGRDGERDRGNPLC